MSLNLNLPAIDRFMACRNVLIAGMGGGFDVYAGLPVYFELQRRRIGLHLASLCLRDVTTLESDERLSETLAGVSAGYAGRAGFFPELHLARWFAERVGEAVMVWCFHKTGVRPLVDNYRALIERLEIDGLLLVGGGVGGLLRGDEGHAASMVEESVSLAAASELTELAVRLAAFVGLGAEPDIDAGQVVENIAGLAREEALLGACALAKQMAVSQLYQDAVLTAHDQPHQPASAVDSAVIAGVQGAYGDYHLTDATRGKTLHVSPLTGLYWFFELEGVARRNLFCERLAASEAFMDAYRVVVMEPEVERRGPAHRPLP